jgi:hypothetical protein
MFVGVFSNKLRAKHKAYFKANGWIRVGFKKAITKIVKKMFGHVSCLSH